MNQHSHPLPLRLAVIIAIALTLGLATAQAQQRYELITRTPGAIKLSKHVLRTAAHTATLNVDLATFKQVAGESLNLRAVPISNDLSVDLDLQAFSAVASDARLTYTDATGPHPLGPLSVRTYRGRVAGDEASNVFLAISDHSILGVVTTGGASYEIATDERPTAPGTLAAMAVPFADLPEQKVSCGTEDTPFSDEELAALNAPANADPCPQILYTMRGAYDADYELYQDWKDNGGATAAADFLVSLVSAVSFIYERDAQVAIAIGYLNVWTVESDPYVESGFMPIALDEARGYWSSGAMSQIERGFAQTLSTKNWTTIIGIANGFDLICDKATSVSFALVRRIDPVGSANTMAHELGHLMGLRHTHSCTWNPYIDKCAPAESGTCFTGTEQEDGTVMSYCKQRRMEIHQRQIPFLRNRVPTWANCTVEARKLEIAKTLLFLPTVNIGNPIDTTFPDFFVNRSKLDVTVSKFEIIGDIYNQFEVASPTVPFTVPSCGKIPLRLKFKADKDTLHGAKLYVTHDGVNPTIEPKHRFMVDLQAGVRNDQPDFSFFSGARREIDFRDRKIADRVDTVMKSPRDLFMNIGTAPLRVDSTMIVGPNRYEFELVSGGAPFSLFPGERRPATVRFAPTTVGAKTAWLVAYSNTKDGIPDSLLLKGNARQGARLEMHVPDYVVNFGDVLLGRTYDSTLQDFFFNSGTDTLLLNTMPAGTHAEMFPGLNWTTELAPGEGMPLSISFYAEWPESWGWKTAMMIVATNTPKGLDTVRLTAKVVGNSAVPGANPAESGAFMIVPNPTDGDARIIIAPAFGEIGRDYTLRITDAAGRELRRESGRFTAAGIHTMLHRSDLPDGVYHVSVTTDKGVRAHAVTVTH